MDYEASRKRITAIIPAYNEGERLHHVLDVITTYPNFLEIIVVDDGSTDATQEVMNKYPNVVDLRNETNMGKGYSMNRAVEAAKGDIIFFSDADVTGLTHHIIDQICNPVLNESVEMFIGMRNRKIYYLRFILSLIPLLGGERALTKSLWQKVPDQYKDRFKIEAALNFYAKYHGKGFSYAVFPGLDQTIKEKKYGLLTGLRSRIRMFWEVMAAEVQVTFIDVPHTLKSARIAFLGWVGSIVGIILGVSAIIAALTGPRTFLLTIYAEDLARERHTPVIDLLLLIASNTSITVIMTAGIILLLSNTIVFSLNMRKAYTLMRIVRTKQPLQIEKDL